MFFSYKKKTKMNRFRKVIVCTLLLALINTDFSLAATTRRTIVLFGIAGVGKSTISNCILNQKS